MKKKNISLPLGIFILIVVFDILTYCFQKIAVINSSESGIAFYTALISTPWFWLALILGPIQLYFWIKLLSKSDLSLAYPITSISTPIIVILAYFLFKENLNWQVWLGSALISSGIFMLNYKE